MTGLGGRSRVNTKLIGVLKMNTFTKFAATAASILAFSAISATAQADVHIAVQHAAENGGAIFEIDSDPVAALFVGSYGGFDVDVYSGTASIYPMLLGTAGHSMNLGGGGAGTLDVYVTVDDLADMPTAFFSSFTSNILTAGWTLQIRSYVDSANGLYGGTLLSDTTFTGAGVYQETLASPGTPGSYSVTARYTITAPTTGEALSNAAITAVPEPGTWALMIMGFGGAGAMLRSRRRAVAAV
jgi:hypothetical protein